MVGRLSPRKGVDVALDAVGLLRRSGVDASLSVCGSVFPGYEWYEGELRERAAQPDLATRLAEQGEREAAERFSVVGYRATMARIVGELLGR